MKNSYYMKHDFNSQDDEKILELRARFGWQGFGLYWAINEQLAQATDYKLSNKRLNGLALKLSTSPKELSEFISACVEIELYAQDGDMFYSKRLRNDMIQYNDYVEQQVSNGKKGRKKQLEQKKGTPGAPPGDPRAINYSNYINETIGTEEEKDTPPSPEPNDQLTPEWQLYDKACACFGSSPDNFITDGRKRYLRLIRGDVRVGADLFIRACENRAMAPDVPGKISPDYFFCDQWQERITEWAKGPPKYGSFKDSEKPNKKRNADIAMEWLRDQQGQS